ncbi:MAG: radical SAM protein, partial [Alistipes ihumii]|nr:radical SAM protein [Alistipes ihumii]
TGINTGDFGKTTGERFVDLLRALDGVRGIDRYRISSIEPNLLSDEVIAFTAASEKFQPHFHIPIQSGCDRILGLMRRRYNTTKFAERIGAVRCAMPDAFLGIDVIVGFPGETDDDFARTYDFLERIEPAFLHVFPYSVRPGTPAADLPGRVPAPVIERRAAALGELCDRLHRAFCRSYNGRTASVLWESTRRDGRMFGYSENYIKVRAPFDRSRVNTISPVVLRASDDGAAMDATFLA